LLLPNLVAKQLRNQVDESKEPRARIFDLLEGLGVRFFRVPLQVAAWHYLYVTEHHSYGWGVIPFVGKFYDVQNLAEQVYKAYGYTYSGGDLTSTSTAPTTFIISYGAHLGWTGVFLALSLLILLDAFSVKLVNGLFSPIKFAAFGFLGTVAINMMSSDIFTIMFSHGGFFGLCLFYVFKKISSRSAC
jgi:hypothetical protein